MYTKIIESKFSEQLLEVTVWFLDSSKHFVPEEGGILLSVHREDPVLLCRTGVGEGKSLFMWVGNRGLWKVQLCFEKARARMASSPPFLLHSELYLDDLWKEFYWSLNLLTLMRNTDQEAELRKPIPPRTICLSGSNHGYQQPCTGKSKSILAFIF